MSIIGRKIAGGLTGFQLVWLTGCVTLTFPATDPDKHPRPGTAPSEIYEVAYFRYDARWHQMRVSMTAGKPTPSGTGYLVKFSADTSLWRYNRKTGEYDIRAKFVQGDVHQNFYVGLGEDGPGSVTVRPVSGDSHVGGTTGWRSRPYTQLLAGFSAKSDSASTHQQTVSGVGAATFHPNGSDSAAFYYHATIERSWNISYRSKKGVIISPVVD